MTIDLESIGITREELQDRVVQRVATMLMTSVSSDDNDREYSRDSEFKRKLDAKIEESIAAAIDALAQRCVLPNIVQMVEELTLRPTNKWGEKNGEPLTFIEYLTQRADAYLREEVNYEGKTKGQDSYSWRSYGTRISFIVDKHLQSAIQRAMDDAVKNANESIKDGLADAVKIALAKISTSMKLTVEQKS